MTTLDPTIVKAETYQEIIHQLNLESTFAEIVGDSPSTFDANASDILPVALVQDTLDAADGEYYMETPETGSDPRYRILVCDSDQATETANCQTPTYYVTNGSETYGPYVSEDRAHRRKARWSTETDTSWTVVDNSQILTNPELPFPNEADGPQKHIEVTNYDDIRSALSLILDAHHQDSKQKLLEMLDDAVANNADSLLTNTDIP